jgi:hypothetical protein
MTRPTILDLDLVVVPREATDEMLDAGNERSIEVIARTGIAYPSDIFPAMLSASPYPTAWDDVRKYVEGLEAQLVAVAGPCSLGVGCEQYGVCYADAHGKPEECGKPSFECEALKDARRIADHDKKLWLAAEAKIEILIAENSRIQSELEEAAGLEKAAEEELSAAEARIAELEKEKHAALTMIAELEKRLADAEMVIEPFADGRAKITHANWCRYHGGHDCDCGKDDYLRAARAYMEGKE